MSIIKSSVIKISTRHCLKNKKSKVIYIFHISPNITSPSPNLHLGIQRNKIISLNIQKVGLNIYAKTASKYQILKESINLMPQKGLKAHLSSINHPLNIKIKQIIH